MHHQQQAHMLHGVRLAQNCDHSNRTAMLEHSILPLTMQLSYQQDTGPCNFQHDQHTAATDMTCQLSQHKYLVSVGVGSSPGGNCYCSCKSCMGLPIPTFSTSSTPNTASDCHPHLLQASSGCIDSRSVQCPWAQLLDLIASLAPETTPSTVQQSSMQPDSCIKHSSL